jgi:uncharacterized protein YbbC (DUF1343 family)
MVKTAYEMYPDHFQWRQNAYEYEFDKNPFDVICGTDKTRKQIEAGDSLKEIEESSTDGINEFAKLRRPYLLY